MHNVAPTVVLTGADEVTEGTTHTYTFEVDDPGDDEFSVVAGYPDCGNAGATNNGVLVADSLELTATGGSFKCSFPDGDATANVTIKVVDSDGLGDSDSRGCGGRRGRECGAGGERRPPIRLRMRASRSRSTWVRSPIRAMMPTGRSMSIGASGSTESYATGTKGALGGRLHHVFGDGDATYTVIVSVTDKDGVSDSATFDVVVSNVAPTVVLSGADTASEGDVVHYTYSIFDPGADTVQLGRSELWRWRRAGAGVG